MQRGENTYLSQDNTTPKGIICQSYINKTSNKKYTYFVNRTGKNVELKLISTASKISINAIEADVPYASAGKTSYEKNYRYKLQPVRYRQETIATNKVMIAPYAFGYLEY